MPKLVTDVRDFLDKSHRKDAKYVKILKSARDTKFKLRCSKYLYTLKVTDKEKADKLAHALAPSLTKKEIK